MVRPRRAGVADAARPEFTTAPHLVGSVPPQNNRARRYPRAYTQSLRSQPRCEPVPTRRGNGDEVGKLLPLQPDLREDSK